jgi:hypothetical protein
MFWIAMLVIVGYAVHVLRPDERRRVLETLDHYFGVALDAIQKHRNRSDPFLDVLRARTRGPFVTAAILALNLAIFAVMLGGAAASAIPTRSCAGAAASGR